MKLEQKEVDDIVLRNKKIKDNFKKRRLKDIIEADFEEPELKHIARKELHRLCKKIYDNE